MPDNFIYQRRILGVSFRCDRFLHIQLSKAGIGA